MTRVSALVLFATFGPLLVKCVPYNPFTDPEIPSGLGLFADDCSDEVINVAKAAYGQIWDFLEAGMNALHDEDESLYRFFFKEEEKEIVKRAFSRLWLLIQKKTKTSFMFQCGPFLGDFCGGNESAKMQIPHDPDNWYPSGKVPKNSFAILCPGFTDLEDSPNRTPDPCDKRELEWREPAWKGLILLHELFHTPYLLGPQYFITRDITYRTAEAHALTAPDQFGMDIKIKPTIGLDDPPLEPIWSVSNYVFFAKWAWMKKQQSDYGCLGVEKPLWGALDDESSNEKDELRKLLGDPGSPPATAYYVDESILFVDIKEPSNLGNSPTIENFTFGSFNNSAVAWSSAHGFNGSAVWNISVSQPITNVTISWTS